MTTYASNLLAINALCIASGGTGGHQTTLPALNELCSLQGVAVSHESNLPALNALAVGLGSAGGYVTNLGALNAISLAIGGTADHVDCLSAWSFIATTGLGLSSLQSSMAIWLGDLDFANNKWLDKTGNTSGATLGGGNCILVTADLTVTLSTARIGATVSKVNGSATTTGVTVNGSGHIAIANATIPSPKKVASIELSTGEEFRFTAGAGRVAFASGDVGLISGTAGTEWSWSTIDSIHLNWKNGFSDAYEMTDGASYLNFTTLAKINSASWFRLKWGNAVINTSSANAVFKLMDETEAFPLNCVMTYSGGNTLFDFGSYTAAGYKDVRCTKSGNYFAQYHTYEFEFDGVDKTALGSFTFKIDGVAQTLTAAGGNTGSGNTTTIGFNNVSGNYSVCFWNYFKLESGTHNTMLILAGRSSNLASAAMPIPLIPSFNGTTDALGRSVTGSAATNFHNGCESWFKMPVDETIQANDVNSYLYTSTTPNALYSSAVFDVISTKKIVCNNTNRYAIQDFIVLKEAVSDSVLTLINAYNSAPTGKLLFRTDRTQDNQTYIGKTINTLTNYFEALDAAGLKGSMIYPLVSFGPVAARHLSAFANGHSFEMHDEVQLFFTFATYEDGKATYDNESAGNRTTYGLTTDMGKISGSITVAEIERLHTASGLAYPGDVAPVGTDNNNVWWEYVIQAYKAWAASTGLTLTMFSPLGSAGNTYRAYHKELQDIIRAEFRTYSGTTLNGSGSGDVVSYTDSIDSSVIPFKGKGLSIYNDGSLNWVKMAGYGGVANGVLNLGTLITGFDPIRYSNYVLQFQVKCTQVGSYMPLKKIVVGGVATTFANAGNINVFANYNVTNTMAINTTYTIKIEKIGGNHLLTVYSAAGAVLIASKKVVLTDPTRVIYFETDGDTLIRNISFEAFDRKGILYLEGISFDGTYSDYLTANAGATWQTFTDASLKPEIVRDIMSGLNTQLFFHELGSFADISDTGLDNVRYGHSLDAMNRVITWAAANSVPVGNPATVVRASSSGRVNYFPNPKFEATKYGVTIIDAANVSTEIAPDKSSAVYKIPTSTAKAFTMLLPSSGLYRFKFWMKGTAAVNFSANHTILPYPGYSYTDAAMTKREIVLNIGAANTMVSITFTTSAVTHVACPVFERLTDLVDV